MVRRALAVLLLLEAAYTGVWVAHVVPMLAVYDWPTDVAIVARGFVGALQCVSWWLLVRGLPPADVFARAAFLLSAALIAIEIGFNVAPNSVFPLYRWPVVLAYWVYTLAAIATLRATAKA